MKSFRELGVSSAVADALSARSIESPFAIQSLVIPDALVGRDLLAKSPTGSGKTLAFAVPIVERLDRAGARPSALILVPTRELANQVALEFADIGAKRGLKVAAVYGGTPVGAQAKRARDAHILVATPGRLEDLAQRRLVRLDGIGVLVLDEADRMLDMGFKPQVDAIVRRLPAKRQTMFFSATLDGEVGELARKYTLNPSRYEAELPAHPPRHLKVPTRNHPRGLAGRVVSGMVAERWGAKQTLIAMLSLQAPAILLYLFAGSAASFYAVAAPVPAAA